MSNLNAFIGFEITKISPGEFYSTNFYLNFEKKRNIF
jgi:hypothetical protein